MRTANYNRMVNYNISVPDVNVPIVESLFKKYNVIVEPEPIVAEPMGNYTPNEETIRAIEEGRREYEQGLLKGYTNIDELFNALEND
ncbi:flagellar motor switch protein FliM [Capnocytophaga leadbetteri]|uniref:flagellar motor switch protein FliM n=1 Tax=Capnocytophaga leadbetteri TaxID=327575 RepID=UPI0026E9D301|nr:flagellar motor switch protein FliM [Capnocytophaga leadbetteri]